MTKVRLEAFSDGVIAILITIMVLELHVPHEVTWEALSALVPIFLTYVLSFVFVGIYWNNHHHLFQAVQHVNGRILWANLHLLFWLSLTPFVVNSLSSSSEVIVKSAFSAFAGSVVFEPVLAALFAAELELAVDVLASVLSLDTDDISDLQPNPTISTIASAINETVPFFRYIVSP